MDPVYFIVSIGSIALAGHMARARNRSFKTWLWTAALIGPLAPLALVFLGKLDGSEVGYGEPRPKAWNRSSTGVSEFQRN